MSRRSDPRWHSVKPLQLRSRMPRRCSRSADGSLSPEINASKTYSRAFRRRIRRVCGLSAHVYFALLASDDITPWPGGNAPDSRWFGVRGEGVKESLAFDHAEIVRAALVRLRSKVEYTSLPAFLLPAEFTLTQLQKIYEAVLGRTLEKKAFRTRVLAAGILEALPRKLSGPNRPAQLYRLKRRRQAHIFSRPFGSADDPG